MEDDVEALLAEQIAYYRAHAPDYDIVYLDKDWDQSIEELPITGDVLELACGTGHWTPLLVARARSVTALDAAPEALALARQRVQGLPVEFVQTDVFAWEPPRRYDTVFFAFWLTHVPPARFADFWSMVGAALALDGRVCFLDDSSRERAGERSCPTSRRPQSGAPSARPAARCLSAPPEGPATSSRCRPWHEESPSSTPRAYVPYNSPSWSAAGLRCCCRTGSWPGSDAPPG